MLPSPRIVAIDDDESELYALVNALNEKGHSCLAIQYSSTGHNHNIKDARVIFFDLHLNGNSAAPLNIHFSIILSILESLAPQGPYVIILWTKYGQSEGTSADTELQEYLSARLEKHLARPYKVLALDKAGHLLNGKVKNPDALISEVETLLCSHPQIRALLSWESNVQSAAAQTLGHLLRLTSPDGLGTASVMAVLADAAVGKANIDIDRYHALNQALIPILSDYISNPSIPEVERSVWEQAYSASNYASILTPDQKADFNKFINLSTRTHGISLADRGAISSLNNILTVKDFINTFGMSQEQAAIELFSLLKPEHLSEARWIICQAHAACDHAQNKSVPMSYFVGLEIEDRYLKPRKNRPEFLWVSPAFRINGKIRSLVFNAGANIPLPTIRTKEVNALYRLNESILNDLLFKLRTHLARPGIIGVY